jgi:hypothetical protein
VAKKNGADETKALATVEVGKFQVAKADVSIGEVLEVNLSGGKFDLNDLDRIRIPAGGVTQWSVPSIDGDDDYESTVEGVIVGIKPLRAFWAKSFDEAGGGAPPDCYSNDTVMGYGDPLQNGKTDWYSCEECPNSKFGSASRGEGQACKEMRMVMVIRENDLLPVVISLPPTSLKKLQQYMMRLGSRGLKYYEVITRFKLSKVQNQAGIGYAVAEFQAAGLVDTPQVFAQYRNDLGKVLGNVIKVTSDDYVKQATQEESE